jgi:hypothetical protein
MDLQTPFSPDDLFIGLCFATLSVAAVGVLSRHSEDVMWIMLAWVAKLAVSFAYSLWIWHLFGGAYETEGFDSMLYRQVGVAYANDARQVGFDALAAHVAEWLTLNATERMYVVSGFLHFLFLDSFLAASFTLALVGFVGQLLLYQTFVRNYPDLRVRRWWCIGLLFCPSVMYWSGGLLKDPLGLCGLGCALWGAQQHRHHRRGASFAWIAVAFCLLASFRPHVIPVLLLAWLLPSTIGLRYQDRQSPGRVPHAARLVGRLVVGVLCIVAVPYMWHSDAADAVNESWSGIAESAVATSSEYEAKAITDDTSVLGAVKAAPLAIFSSLYRPLPWEAGGLTALIAALENTVFLLLTVVVVVGAARNVPGVVTALRAPMFLPCVVFVAVFSAAVGLSTPNLGTLSRYRVPAVPFFVGALTILSHHCRRSASQRSHFQQHRQRGSHPAAVQIG